MRSEFNFVFRDREHFYGVIKKLDAEFGRNKWGIKGSSVLRQLKKGKQTKKTIYVDNAEQSSVNEFATMISLL